MKTLLRDLRYGLRMLFLQPGFSAAAILVLALGIGGSTAMFSIVNVLLLKPIQIHNPQEIVGCFSRDATKPDSYRAFSYPNFADLRDSIAGGNGAFSAVAAHNVALAGLAEGETTRRVFADMISSNYFAMLGVPLYRGRAFTAAEERPGSGIPVAIVSYSYWRRAGSPADLLGQTRRVNGKILTIVGITAEGFTGTAALLSPEFYLPLGMYESFANDFDGPGKPLAARANPSLIVLGRLRPGVTAQSADALLAPVAARMTRDYPAENHDQVLSAHALSRVGISDAPSDGNEPLIPSVLLMSMAAVVLLIASLNVANMMLARGAARTRELAIRQALGAGSGAIARQLFTEGLLLAIIGGAAGIALSYSGTNLLMTSLSRVAPIDLLYNGAPDTRVLLATLGFCALSALLFSLGPARTFSKTGIVAALKSGEANKDGVGRRVFSRRNLLVMGQIALSMTLLTAAGSFIRSAVASASVQPGFRLDNGVLIEIDPSLAGYDAAKGRVLYGALLDRLRRIPGVESASVAATVPFGMVSLGRKVQLAGGAPVSCRFNAVGEDYFATLGIPLLRGREFSASEERAAPSASAAGQKPTRSGPEAQAGVVVIDRVAADRFWPGGDAVGKHLNLLGSGGAGAGRDVEVIGVAANVQEDVFGQSQPHVYAPFAQDYQSDMNIHLKLAAGAAAGADKLLETIRREIGAVDSRVPVLALKTLRGHLDTSFDLWIVRTSARMFSVFGAVALLLATVGLYSLRAYTAARRTREIGIRLALGADPRDARRLILREGLIITSIGAAVGLSLSLLAGKLLASLLYKVSGVDPVVFGSAIAILGAVSLLACYVPALRVSRIDPMVALRHE